MSSPRECKYCGRPVKEGKNCTCHESFYMRKNAELQQQLEQAQARVAELEESGMELYGAILTNHRFFELRDDRLTDAMDDWLEVTAPKRQQADELEQQNGDTNAP